MVAVPFAAMPHPAAVRAHTETLYLVLLLRLLMTRLREEAETVADLGGVVENQTYARGLGGGEEEVGGG